MPRFFRLLGVCLLALSAACGKAEKDDGRVRVRYLAAPDVGGFSKVIIERFEKANPGVKVEMVEGPASSDTRENMYSSSFMAKEDTYDLAYVDIAWMPKLASQGWLLPLDERFGPKERKEFLAGTLAGASYGTKLYGVPIQADGGVLYYRKDLLAAKGLKPPKTWDELVAAAKAAQTPEISGFVFQGKQYEGLVCAFLELAWGFGGDLIDGAGKVRIDEKPSVDALQALVDAIHKHKIAPEAVLTYQEEEARNVFQEGKAVFMRNWPYAWNLMESPSSPVRGKVGMIPMVHGPGGKSAATLGGWAFGVSAYSKHPDEAYKLAAWFASAESEKLAFQMGGILPTRRSVYQDPELLKASPWLKELYGVLATTRPRPPPPKWSRISDALQVRVSAALSKQEEPGPALKAAAAEIRTAAGAAD